MNATVKKNVVASVMCMMIMKASGFRQDMETTTICILNMK